MFVHEVSIKDDNTVTVNDRWNISESHVITAHQAFSDQTFHDSTMDVEPQITHQHQMRSLFCVPSNDLFEPMCNVENYVEINEDEKRLKRAVRLGGVGSLLRTCRQVYQESIDLIYAQPTFLFTNQYVLDTFRKTILTRRRRLIRRLTLAWVAKRSANPPGSPLRVSQYFSGLQQFHVPLVQLDISDTHSPNPRDVLLFKLGSSPLCEGCTRLTVVFPAKEGSEVYELYKIHGWTKLEKIIQSEKIMKGPLC